MGARMRDGDETGLFSYTQILHLLKIEFARAQMERMPTPVFAWS
jgi:hypothetical protein